MSRELLINDLRAKGKQQIESLWRDSREELERFRTDSEARVVAERNSCDLSGREATQALHRQRSMAARRRAGEITTLAEQQLSDRLYDLARECLSAWSGDRPALLSELAAELPGDEWARIRVHPRDVAAAERLFPARKIVADDQVLGGVAVTNQDGSVTIDNTLNTRLERIWSRLLPELLREARRDATAG